MPEVRVVVVDDQEPFRSAARAVVEVTNGFTFAGEATSGAEAVELCKEVEPDLVLLDVRMPGMDGFETARRIGPSHPDTVVVLLSSYASAPEVAPKEALSPAFLVAAMSTGTVPLSATPGVS
jgi:DNA-binding NarL/FixJ family response regulator